MHRYLFFWAALLLFIATEGHAAKKKPVETEPPPPMAQPVDVEVFRGESVKIPLVARGRYSKNDYILRSQPKLGTISEVQTDTAGNGIVIYKHGGGTTPANDEFFYAVQAAGTPVSAQARVRIKVKERPAVFVPPGDMDFGKVIVGKEGVLQMTLANSGGATLSGKMKVDSGWDLAGNTTYEIKGGEAILIPLRFAPSEEKEYWGALHFSHNPKLLVRLKGEGLDALKCTPYKIELYHDAGKKEASIELKNQTGEPMTIHVSADPGVVVPPQIEIPPGVSWRLPVTVAEGFRGGANGAIRIAHPMGNSTVGFLVYPVPAKLETEGDGIVRFGQIKPKEDSEQKVVIRNTGGVPAAVSLNVPPQVKVDGPQNFSIPAESQKELTVHFLPVAQGVIERRLSLRYGSELCELTLRATVVSGKSETAWNGFSQQKEKEENAPAPAATPDRPNAGEASGIPKTGTQRTTSQTPGKKGGKFQITPYIETVGMTVISQTTNSVVLEWESEYAGKENMEIQRRIMDIAPNGAPIELWRTMENAQLASLEGEKMRATFFGLPPGGGAVVKIVQLGKKGECVAESERIAVSTRQLPPKEGMSWKWIFLPLVLASAWWMVRWRRKKENAETESRLKNLEKRY